MHVKDKPFSRRDSDPARRNGSVDMIRFLKLLNETFRMLTTPYPSCAYRLTVLLLKFDLDTICIDTAILLMVIDALEANDANV